RLTRSRFRYGDIGEHGFEALLRSAHLATQGSQRLIIKERTVVPARARDLDTKAVVIPSSAMGDVISKSHKALQLSHQVVPLLPPFIRDGCCCRLSCPL